MVFICAWYCNKLTKHDDENSMMIDLGMDIKKDFAF